MRKLIKNYVCRLSVAALSLTVVMTASTTVSANEKDAKKLLKGISDYLASQKTLEFGIWNMEYGIWNLNKFNELTATNMYEWIKDYFSKIQ